MRIHCIHKVHRFRIDKVSWYPEPRYSENLPIPNRVMKKYWFCNLKNMNNQKDVPEKKFHFFLQRCEIDTYIKPYRFENIWNKTGMKASYLKYISSHFKQYSVMPILYDSGNTTMNGSNWWNVREKGIGRVLSFVAEGANVPALSFNLIRSIRWLLLMTSVYPEKKQRLVQISLK